MNSHCVPSLRAPGPSLGLSYRPITSSSGNLPMEWLMVGLELAVALIIALAVYLTLKK